MNDNLPEILAEIRHYFQELYGERLVQLILYGSQARGDAKPDSDKRRTAGNGLFRAVHLVPGTHVVTFTYRPSKLYAGALISAATAAALALWCAWGARQR